jgi:hypothetical protein
MPSRLADWAGDDVDEPRVEPGAPAEPSHLAQATAPASPPGITLGQPHRQRTARQPSRTAVEAPATTTPSLVDGRPTPTWPPEPSGPHMPPSAVFAGMPDATSGSTVGSAKASKARRWGLFRTQSKSQSQSGDEGAAEDLSFEAPTTLPSWLVAIGSAVAAAAFLLPWSSTAVGAKSFGGYTDSWGFASPSHLLVWLAAVAVLILTVTPNRVPAWLRTEVAGLVLGGVLLGFAWPYVIGGWPGGASIGIFVETIAALALVSGGILAVRQGRHGEDVTGV